MWRKVLGIGAVVLLVGALVGGGAYIVLRDDGGQGSGRQEGRGGGGLGGSGSRSGAGLAWGNGGNGGRGGAGAGSGILGGGGGSGRAGAGLLNGGGAGWAGRTPGNGGDWDDPGVLGDPGSGEKARGRRAGAERAIADDARTWQAITATVLAADTDLVVQVADGTTLTVSIGPARYRGAQGVSLLPGDTVRLVGFENNDGTFVPGEIENLSRGGVLILRDASGQPLWSGRGRRGS